MIERADVETSSDAYARRFAGPVGQWLLDRQAVCTADLLSGVPAGARVLDVGGGHAQLTPLLASRGYDVTVIGSSAACAVRLQRWLSAGTVRFDVGDPLDLPFADRSFDVVLSFRLLPHVEEWPRLVAELCRVAARSVVVDYPSRRSVNVFADRLFAAKKGIEGDTRPFTVFVPAEIAAAFARHGFHIAGERGQFFLPMALHRGLGSAAVARMLEAVPRAAGLTASFGSPRVVRADRRAAVQGSSGPGLSRR